MLARNGIIFTNNGMAFCYSVYKKNQPVLRNGEQQNKNVTCGFQQGTRTYKIQRKLQSTANQQNSRHSAAKWTD